MSANTRRDGTITFAVGDAIFSVKGIVTRLYGASADAARAEMPAAPKAHARTTTPAPPMRPAQERKKTVIGAGNDAPSELSGNTTSIELGW